jgi:two-component system, NtrC family, response regulator HydG
MDAQRILIVDDDPQVRGFLSDLVAKKISSRCTAVGDGSEALKLLKQESFSLVLLDIKMPGLSGIDVIKDVMRFSPVTKILVLSAYDSQDVADEAIRAGASDYILKSHSHQEIELKIKRALGSG